MVYEMYEIEKISNEIFCNIISPWYKARQHRGFFMMFREFFPKEGFIVKKPNTSTYLYAGWLYQSDSSIAVLDWIIGNPKHKDETALKFLIEKLCELAKEKKYKCVCSIFDTNGLILNKLFSKLDFKASEKLDLFVKVL